MLNLQQKLSEEEEKTFRLESQVDLLNGENIKLSADLKVVKGEQSEILHNLYQLEKKNNNLQQENQTLKRMV